MPRTVAFFKIDGASVPSGLKDEGRPHKSCDHYQKPGRNEGEEKLGHRGQTHEMFVCAYGALSSALGQGQHVPALRWHTALSAAKVRGSGPVRRCLPTGPLRLPEFGDASAREAVVAVHGIEPGRKKGLAPAKRSLCFIGRLSLHAGRIPSDG